MNRNVLTTEWHGSTVLVRLVVRETSMESSVGSFEARTHLPALLERVARGERITITKHGKHVAKLVPVEPAEIPDVKHVVSEMLAY
jgi:prevent-host-death family protein